MGKSTSTNDTGRAPNRLRGIRPPYLFLCLPIAAAYLLTAYPAPTSSTAQPIQAPAAFLMLSLLACAVTLATIAVRLRHHPLERPPFGACTVCLLAGTLIYLLRLVAAPRLTDIVFAPTLAAAALLGAGGALLLVLWACAYTQLPQEHVLPNVAASTLLAGLIVALSTVLAPALDTTTKALTFLVISSVPLVGVVHTDDDGVMEAVAAGPAMAKGTSTEDTDAGAAKRPVMPVAPNKVMAAEDWQLAGLAMGVLILYWAVCACSWSDVVVEGAFMGSVRDELACSIGTVVGAAALLWACGTGARDGSERAAEFVASVVAAALLMATWALSQFVPSWGFFLGVVLGLGQGLALCTSITAVARTSRWTGPVDAVSVGGAFMCVLLMVLAGAALVNPTAGTTIAVVLNAAYLTVAAAWGVHVKRTDGRI